MIPQGFRQPPCTSPCGRCRMERALRIDLRKFAGAPGAYRLQGKWDWDATRVTGTVRIHRFDDLAER